MVSMALACGTGHVAVQSCVLAPEFLFDWPLPLTLTV